MSPVRLIGADGEQVGVVPLEQARSAAEAAGMDLVEVGGNARPPVVRVMDWGKHLYEAQKAQKAARKKQHTVDVKEIKLRPATDDHDLEIKIRQAEKFLGEGNKVKVTVRYRGGELRRPEPGYEIVERVWQALQEVAEIESRDRRLMGRQLTMVLAPA